MEYDQTIDNNIKDIINEFQNRYQMEWNKILEQIEILEKIAPEIKERMIISDNKLAKYLKISRYRLRKILLKTRKDKGI